MVNMTRLDNFDRSISTEEQIKTKTTDDIYCIESVAVVRVYESLKRLCPDVDLIKYYWVRNSHILAQIIQIDSNVGHWYNDGVYIHRTADDGLTFSNTKLSLTVAPFRHMFIQAIDDCGNNLSDDTIVHGLIPVLKAVRYLCEYNVAISDEPAVSKNIEPPVLIPRYIDKLRNCSVAEKSKSDIIAILDKHCVLDYTNILDLEAKDIINHMTQESLYEIQTDSKVTITHNNIDTVLISTTCWYIYLVQGQTTLFDNVKYLDARVQWDVELVSVVIKTLGGILNSKSLLGITESSIAQYPKAKTILDLLVNNKVPISTLSVFNMAIGHLHDYIYNRQNESIMFVDAETNNPITIANLVKPDGIRISFYDIDEFIDIQSGLNDTIFEHMEHLDITEALINTLTRFATYLHELLLIADFNTTKLKTYG